MEWVFDKLVAWILLNLCELFNVLSASMFKFFHMQRDTFDAFFSFFGSASSTGMTVSLYDAFRYLALALCVLIITSKLLFNLVSVVSDEYEDPIKLAFRAVISCFVVGYSGQIVDLEFNFMTKPYDTITKMLTNEKKALGGNKYSMWSNFSNNLKDGYGDIGTGNAVVIDLITIGCLCAIFFGFVKLLLEVAERYVVLCIAFYLAPLAFSTASSKSTAKIFHAYLRMILCQLLLMIFNVVFVDGVIIAIYNYVNKAGEMTRYNGNTITIPGFVFCILLLAFITVGQKIDNYMRGLGLDAVQTGSIFDEIRGSALNMMAMGRMLGGAVHAAGGVGRFAANAVGTIAGHRGTTINGAGSTARERTFAGKAAGMGRTVASSLAHNMATSSNGNMNNLAQKAARSQIKSGAFNGVSGEVNKGIGMALETAMGASNFAKMGIMPDSLVGKNGLINFKAANGASGSISFDKMNGNGWKQLSDENGNPMKAWVNGSSNLGISDAKIGSHMALADAVGAGAAKTISESLGSIGTGIDKSNMEAIALGNGEFSLVGSGEDGMQKNLGRIVSADIAGKIDGATLASNELGGTAGFIPTTNVAAAMENNDFDCGYIHFDQNKNIPVDAVTDALNGPMESNNIPVGTAMLGFDTDGQNYTATFADPVSGFKNISGQCSDLLGQISPDDIKPDIDDRVGGDNRSNWTGMSQIFDTNAYSAMTGATPKSIELNDDKNSWTITNEDGSKNILEKAADSGSYTRVIGGGEIIDRIPLSIRSAPRENDSFDNGYGNGRKKPRGKGNK